MALHSRPDFAVLTGLSAGNLTTYIQRRKIVLSGKFVDDAIEPNASFLQKRREILAQKEVAPAEIPAKLPNKTSLATTGKPEIAAPDLSKPAPKGLTKPVKNPLYETEKKIKEVELQQKEANYRISLLREEKIRGESIPVTLVKDIFTQLGTAIITSYRDGAENFLQEICFTRRIPDEELARLRGRLVEIINKSHSDAIEAAKKSVKTIKEEYVQSKDKQTPELDL